MATLAKPARRVYDDGSATPEATAGGSTSVTVSAGSGGERYQDSARLLDKGASGGYCSNTDCARDRAAKWNGKDHPWAVGFVKVVENAVMLAVTAYAFMAGFELGNIVVTNELVYVWFNAGIAGFFTLWWGFGWYFAYKNAQVEKLSMQDKVAHPLPFPSMHKYTVSWVLSRMLLWWALTTTEGVFYKNYNYLYPTQQNYNLVHLFWTKIVLVVLTTYPYYRAWWCAMKNKIRDGVCGSHYADI